jgi:hypothetical protein
MTDELSKRVRQYVIGLVLVPVICCGCYLLIRDLADPWPRLLAPMIGAWGGFSVVYLMVRIRKAKNP